MVFAVFIQFRRKTILHPKPSISAPAKFIHLFNTFQHKDDPLFAEFIEAHVNDKTAWIKEAFQNAAKSDDDDSGVEDEKPSAPETPTEVTKEESNTKVEEKVANKHISDLEV